MEKKQYKLCMEVLKRFNDNGILSDNILIGSWCLPFYKEYFISADYDLALRTRDIDFLIPLPPAKRRAWIDIATLLADLGFIVAHSYPSGYMKLQHPDLIIEFLTPEKGKGADKPCPLPHLGLNAQPLRFLTLLSENTILVNIAGIPLRLPHPVNFALHKLIVAGRRQNVEKAEKDRQAAAQVLKALIQIGQRNKIRDVYISLPKKWQKLVTASLDKVEEIDRSWMPQTNF